MSEEYEPRHSFDETPFGEGTRRAVAMRNMLAIEIRYRRCHWEVFSEIPHKWEPTVFIGRHRSDLLLALDGGIDV